ncbi:YDG domain-containing protein [Fodinicurvata sp. EGI_FJ10296]|uniref:YDG domain-containing protein n=1 Tax=Fodinicurvata sp. EGI_FJ10296 TaxID=3231908 RepID=UPI003457325F
MNNVAKFRAAVSCRNPRYVRPAGGMVSVSRAGTALGAGAAVGSAFLAIAGAALPGLTVSSTSVAFASGLPADGTVMSGDGTIAIDGQTMTIRQLSDRLGIDWREFSIGPDNTVVFNQPSASAAALNRVTGGEPSAILGALQSNGRVFLVNPNGIVFGADAAVDVGALVASTLDLGHDDFQNGELLFDGDSGAAIVNLGQIRAADGGTVALVAARIENAGTITADRGAVLMGAGSRVRLDMGGPASIEVEEAAVDALIEQGGAVRADGGRVIMEARGAGDLAASVINHTGVTEARTLETGNDGSIRLTGGMDGDRISVGGSLDASAPASGPDGGDGGIIETSAARVDIADDVHVTTDAPAGQTGEWVIDPTDIEIVEGPDNADITGPTTINNAAIDAALATTDVTIETAEAGADAGDITINAPISWSSGNRLTLSAHRDIVINEVIDASTGSGGHLALHFGQATDDGAGGGYRVNHSGGKGRVDLQAGSNFSTRQGATGAVIEFEVITDLGVEGDDDSGALTLQGLSHSDNLAGSFVLGADINAAATATWNADAGFTPVGESTDPFTGRFDGLGHKIDGLTIDTTNDNYVGMFGSVVGADVRHIGLSDASVAAQSAVGALVGYAARSTISNVYATGSVAGQSFIGGLIGYSIDHSEIAGSYADTAVTAQGERIGGLVGYAYEGTDISNSFAVGDVAGSDAVGGLVGNLDEASLISRSYASGAVEGDDGLGGLVGEASGDSAISYSFAAGPVNEGQTDTNDGGLVGGTTAPSVQDSYWDIDATGQGASQGGVGLASNAMREAASFDSWDIAASQGGGSVWRIYEGQSTPLLRDFMTQATGTVANRAYDGSTAIDLADLTFDHGTVAADLPITGGDFAFADVGTDMPVSLAFDPAADDLSARLQQYDLAVTGAVDRRIITIADFEVQDRPYDATDAATISPGSVIFNNLVATETLNADSPQVTFAQIDAGTDIEATLTTATLADGTNGGKASNYQLDLDPAPTSSGDITPLTLTVSSFAIDDRIYDGTNDASVVPGTLALDGLLGAETLGIGGTDASFAQADADTGIAVALNAATLADGSNGGKASNYVLDLDPAPTALADILRRTVTIDDFAAESRQYDGTDAATVTAGSTVFANLVGAETLTLDDPTASFAQIDAGSDLTVSLTGATLVDGGNGGKASNYTLDLDPAPTAVADILLRDLVVAGFAADDRVYDSTTDATVTAGSLTFNGLIGAETLGIGGTDASFAQADADTGIAVALNAATLTDGSNGGKASNYALDLDPAPTALADILRRTVTIDDFAAETRQYDGTDDATLTADSAVFGNLVGAETLTIDAPQATFAQIDAGSDLTVSLDGATLADGGNGGKASNYTLDLAAAPTAVADILRRDLVVAGFAADDRVYDSTTDATVTAGSLTFNGLIGAETLDIGGTDASFAQADADTGIAVALNAAALTDGSNGGKASNYELDLDPAPTALADILRRTVTIDDFAAETRQYDGTDDATLTAGSAVFGNLVGAETLTIDAPQATFAQIDAGSDLTVSLDGATLADGGNGGKASNYTLDLAAAPTAVADILRRDLVVAGFAADDRVYDSTTDATVTAGSLTFNGLVGAETLGIGGTDASFAQADADTGIAVALNAAALTDGSNGGKASNYVLDLDPAPTTAADIARRPVTVAADDQQRPIDEPDPDFTFAITDGSLAGDDTLPGSLTREPGSAQGAYAIQQGTLDDPNYDITFVDGLLTIAADIEPPPPPQPPPQQPAPPAPPQQPATPAEPSTDPPDPETRPADDEIADPEPDPALLVTAQEIIRYNLEQADTQRRGFAEEEEWTDDREPELGLSDPDVGAGTADNGMGSVTVIDTGVNFPESVFEDEDAADALTN